MAEDPDAGAMARTSSVANSPAGGREYDLTELGVASLEFAQQAQLLADQLRQRADEPRSLHPTASVESISAVSNNLRGCIFVGHTNTDMDSVASAIAAARLYSGMAARSAGGGVDPRDVNGEIMHALQFSGLELPPFFQDVPGAMDEDGPPVCFVDTNHKTQMVEPMPSQMHRIMGCIDHHNLELKTAKPIFMDVRPWGSCCSIIAHNFMRMGVKLSKPVARVLLCGILSDTINLMSPTTTTADRAMMAMLARLAEIEDIDVVAQGQFRAKTASFAALSPYAMVRADMKCFQASSGVRFAWATIEVTDVSLIYAKAPQIVGELRLLKEDRSRFYREQGSSDPELQYAFLSVVDIVHQTSKVLLCGGMEVMLAQAAFGGALSAAPGMNDRQFALLAAAHNLSRDQTMMDLGSRVSRKLEFMPPVKGVLEDPSFSATPSTFPPIMTMPLQNST
jgi:manganese-dependent inorganic pyrophosphatase